MVPRIDFEARRQKAAPFGSSSRAFCCGGDCFGRGQRQQVDA
jgi:hypothetical protein